MIHSTGHCLFQKKLKLKSMMYVRRRLECQTQIDTALWILARRIKSSFNVMIFCFHDQIIVQIQDFIVTRGTDLHPNLLYKYTDLLLFFPPIPT